jgi:tetratricopeptide (TPR) repeat protein
VVSSVYRVPIPFQHRLSLCGSNACVERWRERTATTTSQKPAEQLALRRGQDALRNGNVGRARAEFEKAVRLTPNDAAAQPALGWVLSQQGEADAAVTHLRIAIKLKPGLVEARLTLAGVLAQQGKSAEGEQEARAAVKMAPENAERE